MRAAGVSLLAALTGVALAIASARMGPVVFVGPVLLAFVGVAVWRPEPVLALLLALVVIWEQDATAPGGLPFGARLYLPLAKGITPIDLVVLVLGVAVLLDGLRRRRSIVGAGPMTFGLLILSAGLVAGAATGYFAGIRLKDLIIEATSVGDLIVLPLIVVNVVRTRGAMVRVLVALALLTGFKAVVGIALLGRGQQTVNGTPITYYEPTANWLAMAFVLVVAAAAVRRVRLPVWVWTIAPFALACLALSYRRSFWIAAILGLAIVVLVGAGRRGRRVIIPAVAVAALAGWLALSAVSGQTARQDPLLARVRSLNPTSLQKSADDRYRLDERRNVLATLSDQPLTGVGLGVPWRARYALSEEHANGRHYTHMVVLWYWLNLGPLGVAGYVVLMAAALWMAARVARFHPDRLVAALGLGLLGALGGLGAAELSASFTGVDGRFSVLLPAALGLVAAAHRGVQVPPRSVRARGAESGSGGPQPALSTIRS